MYGNIQVGLRLPAGEAKQGEPLGTYDVTSSHVVVKLTDNALRSVDADAIRIERVNPGAVVEFHLAQGDLSATGGRDLPSDTLFAANLWAQDVDWSQRKRAV